MKIAFYYGSILNGGAEKVIVALANFLTERGNDVTIIVSDDGKSGYDLSPNVTVVALKDQRMSVSLSAAIRNNCISFKKLKQKIQVISPDVIIGFDPRNAVMAKLAYRKTCVIGSERSNPFRERSRAIDKIFVRLSVILDGFIFQTNGASAFYPEKTRKRSAVIPNGIFTDIPCDVTDLIHRNKFSVCASGRLSQVKRYDLMISAMKELVKSYPMLKLDIFGDGGQKQEIQSMIIQNGLEQNVILKGRTEHIFEELPKYRYFFLTSDSEGTPNGLIDAMACGCVCISTDCDYGPSDLITNGENGFLIPTDSYSALAEIMEKVLKLDENCLQSISDKAKTIKDRYSREATLSKYEKYITECVNK